LSQCRPRKKKLQENGIAHQADPAAVARMKFEAANHVEPSKFRKVTGFHTAQSGYERCRKERYAHMDLPKRDIPATVPVTADATPGFSVT
jgi:hypothetical protein